MKELTIILFCTWKFAATFPVAIYVMKMSVLQTLLYTNIGGITGAVLFTFFWDAFIRLWNKYVSIRYTKHKKKARVFSKKSRRYVRIKANYGVPGIVILTPVILSIPVGSFLLVKYYKNKIANMIWLVMGILLWSVIYTFFYVQVKSGLM